MNMDKDETWEKGTSAIYRSIGEFTVKFETVCSSLRNCIIFMLDGAGLKDQRIAHILLASLTVDSLKNVFENLVKLTQGLDDDEQKILRDILFRFQKLTEERNTIIHSTWFIGYGNEDTVDFSEASSYKLYRNGKGKTMRFRKYTAKYLDELTKEADTLSTLFNRVNGCFMLGLRLTNDQILNK
jgi:ATP-dependent DNA ligase